MIDTVERNPVKRIFQKLTYNSEYLASEAEKIQLFLKSELGENFEVLCSIDYIGSGLSGRIKGYDIRVGVCDKLNTHFYATVCKTEIMSDMSIYNEFVKWFEEKGSINIFLGTDFYE